MFLHHFASTFSSPENLLRGRFRSDRPVSSQSDSARGQVSMNRKPKMEKLIGTFVHLTRMLPVAACLPAVVATAQTASPGLQVPLREGWTVQSSTKAQTPGDQISTGSFTPSGWYATSVPKTVLAVLVDNKVFPDPYYGTNLKSIPGYLDGNWLIMKESSPFRDPWWYRLEFLVPNRSKGRLVTFHFDGIPDSARVEKVNTLRMPWTWTVTISFQCLHSSYGDRTGKILLQVVTNHLIVVTVREGIVVGAIIDGHWDEIAQRELF